MSCSLARPEVDDVVLNVVRRVEEEPNASLESRFYGDLGVGRVAREDYHEPINEDLQEKGGADCNIDDLDAEEFQDARTVGQLSEMVWDHLQDDETD